MNKLETEERKHKWHWSSTEYSSTGAWVQASHDGYQISYYKTYSSWARAIRKVKK